MPSAVCSPVRKRPSSRPGNTQSARAARLLMVSRICAGVAHKLGRRLGSKDTLRPALRIRSMLRRASGRVVAEMAGNTPVAWRWRADSSQASSMSLTAMWLAAEPRRWYSTGGSPSSSTRPLIMKPVGCAAVSATREQSTPSADSARIRCRPIMSVPRRLAQPTFRPRRARPVATLVSAPAVCLAKEAASSSGPGRSATSSSMASPKVTTSKAEDAGVGSMGILMRIQDLAEKIGKR